MNNHSDICSIPAWLYQHFDADYSLDVPEDGFGGWKRENLDISLKHTAVVSMHAWDTGSFDQFPGWWHVVPYIPRANAICRDVFPPLFSAIRQSGMKLFHIGAGGDYYKRFPGFQHAIELAGPDPAPHEVIPSDPIRDALIDFKRQHGFPGKHNEEDIRRGFERVDFPPEAMPIGNEGVAENGHQLFALCREYGINHLIYCGFAINWCLLLSPGGMAEMQRYGFICSALRQATAAVENKQSAKQQLCKELGLWRVALSFGFVFDVGDFIHAMKRLASPSNNVI